MNPWPWLVLTRICITMGGLNGFLNVLITIMYIFSLATYVQTTIIYRKNKNLLSSVDAESTVVFL